MPPSAGTDAPASSNAGPDGPQWADGSVGVLQVGFLDIGTPIRVLSDHEDTPPAATASADPGPAETGSDPSPGKGAGGAADDVNGRGAPDTRVVALERLSPDGATETVPASLVRALDTDVAGRLPVAGLELIGLVLLGSLLLAGGSGLRLAQR